MPDLLSIDSRLKHDLALIVHRNAIGLGLRLDKEYRVGCFELSR